MKYKLSEVSQEFLGFGDPSKKKLKNIKQLASEFEYRQSLYSKDLEDYFSNLDVERGKDCPYSKGEVVGKGPDCASVFDRNNFFLKIVQTVAECKLDEVLTKQDLYKLYEKVFGKNKFADYNPVKSSYQLVHIDKEDIVYPSSGWFSSKGKQIESNLKKFIPLYKKIEDKLNAINKDNIEKGVKYYDLCNALLNDVMLMEGESFYWLGSLEK